MVDPAILLSLEALTPPQPPVTVQERVWLSPLGSAAQRVSQRLVDDYRAKVAAWSQQLGAFKAQIEAIHPAAPESAETLTILDRLIEDYEAHADIRALLSGRLAKRVRRDVKALFKIDPSLGAVCRSVGDTLVATDKAIVKELLDFALVLRALRAEASGEDRGGPTFDDPDALRKHLDDLAA